MPRCSSSRDGWPNGTWRRWRPSWGRCRRRGSRERKGNCTLTGPSRTGGALRSFPRLRLGQSPRTRDGPVGAPSSLWSEYVRGSDLEACLASVVRGGLWFGRRRRMSRRLVVEGVRACLAGGRRAIVLVPEASPMPATTAALVEAFGERVCVFAGGDARSPVSDVAGDPRRRVRRGGGDAARGVRAPHGCRARLGLARITPRASRRARALLPRPGCRDPPGAAGRRGVRARGGLSHE